MTGVTLFYCKQCEKEFTLVSELKSILKEERPFCHQKTLSKLPQKQWKNRYGINLLKEAKNETR